MHKQKKITSMVQRIKAKVRGSLDLAKLIEDGLIIGDNFHAQEGVIIDPGHCWLIEIGDNVTLAPRVHILAHDASTKNVLGYTKIARVSIGNNVFIGAGSIVLPGVRIEDNVIIGAGSVVTKDCKSGVYVGNPARKLYGYEDYLKKIKVQMEQGLCYSEEWTYGKITPQMKKKMKQALEKKERAFIV